MPKRSVPPLINEIASLKFPDIRAGTLSCGIPFYQVAVGTQKVVKVEILFRAGHIYERMPLVAGATVRLLKEGTQHYTAREIAELLDFYGCTLRLSSGLDSSSIILFSLSKHLDKLIPLLADMLSTPLFPEKEIEAYKNRRLQQLEIDLTQNDEVADRRFTELIFGDHHPYGYNGTRAGYKSLERSQIKAHFEQFYNQSNCIIFISGRLEDRQLAIIDQHIGGAIPKGPKSHPRTMVLPDSPDSEFVQMPDTLQASIRMGFRLFNRHHKDYKGMYVLNTILGGYFGSRLMTNIREDKGYTYNIYSAIDTMQLDGSFHIGTETAVDYVKETREQIFLELSTLREKVVPEEELQMVRNYLLGTFLGMLDGPFKVSSLLRMMVTDGLPFSYFDELVETVKTITGEEIRSLARQYLKKENFRELIVGP